MTERKIEAALALVREMDDRQRFAFIKHLIETEPELGFNDYDNWRSQTTQAEMAAERRAGGDEFDMSWLDSK
jgi:hypothetical protein